MTVQPDMEMFLPVRVRLERAVTLGLALGDAHPEDAAAICAGYLDATAAGMPRLDPFGDLRTDAEFWADSANPAELNTYACAALRRLGERVQGLEARKRLMAAIWRSLPSAERAAFLRRVTGRG